MNSGLPNYVWVLTFVGIIGIPTMTCVALYRGARATGSNPARAALLTAAAAVLLGGWFAASAVIAGHGWYHTQLGQQPPWLPIATVGFLVALLAAARIPVVARALSGPNTLSRLALPHAFRVLGADFLIAMALGHIPALFALPAGIGDMLVGVSAPFVALRLARGKGRRAALRFNLLGTLDLVVALGLGGLTGFQLIHTTPVNDAITLLPLAMIPTAAVPLLLALHVVSMQRLFAGGRARASVPAPAASLS